MTREDIRRIPELNNRILRDEAHLRYLKEKATAIPEMPYDREKVKTNKKMDRMRYADEAVDLEIEIEYRREALKEMQKDATLWIDTLDSYFDKRIFRLRLIKCLTWEEIADLIGYTSRRVYQIAERVINDKID